MGTIHASYSRSFRFANGASEHSSAFATITSKADGRATARRRREIRNEYPGSTCTTIYDERGAQSGRVHSPSVSVFGGEYQVDYPNPPVEVAINRRGIDPEGRCVDEPTEHREVATLPVYIPISGKAGKRPLRVSGSLRRDSFECTPDTQCQQTQSASWDLHRVDGSGGGGSGGDSGGRSGGGGGGAPGQGCEAKVRSGTSGDDVLEGTPRDELFLALAGNDQARSRGGSDCIWGGDGDDLLAGGGGRDAVGGDPGADRLVGGRGGDRLHARDGERDVVRCGKGDDLAKVDSLDDVAGCERVRRG